MESPVRVLIADDRPRSRRGLQASLATQSGIEVFGEAGRGDMNHLKVVERAWQLAWSYRALWVFGIVLALVTFSWGPVAIFDGDDDEDGSDRGIVITVMGDTPLFVGLALGISVFLLVLIAPLVVLGGLREALASILWTLIYRELHGLADVELEPQAVVTPPGLEAAPTA